MAVLVHLPCRLRDRCPLDYESPGGWDIAFEWWLEIVALAITPPKARGTDQPSQLEFDVVSSAFPRNRTIWTYTSTGHVVSFDSIEFKATLTPKELQEPAAQCEKERREHDEDMLVPDDESSQLNLLRTSIRTS